MTTMESLARQLVVAREERGLTQAALAARVGRTQSRVSELERDLARSRLGKDRLTLLVEICDAFDMVPVLVPRRRAGEVHALLDGTGEALPATRARSAYDDVFIALDDDEDAA